MQLRRIALAALVIIAVHAAAPETFSWDNHNGTSFIPVVRNQNMPAACNSGWALAAADVLNARIKIRRRAASPDLEISSQVLLSCDENDFGCMGVLVILAVGRAPVRLPLDQAKQHN